jgi:hypothetical protein
MIRWKSVALRWSLFGAMICLMLGVGTHTCAAQKLLDQATLSRPPCKGRRRSMSCSNRSTRRRAGRADPRRPRCGGDGPVSRGEDSGEPFCAGASLRQLDGYLNEHMAPAMEEPRMAAPESGTMESESGMPPGIPRHGAAEHQQHTGKQSTSRLPHLYYPSFFPPMCCSISSLSVLRSEPLSGAGGRSRGGGNWRVG